MKLKIFLLFILLSICSCDKPTEPDKFDFTNFRYPLEVGNKWVYHKQVTLINLIPDSVNAIEFFSTGLVTLEVLELDSISTVEPSYKMRGITLDSSGTYSPDTSYFYYNNTDSGLIQYKHDGSNMIVPVTGHSILDRVLIEQKNRINKKVLIDDARIAIKFPVKLNEEWRYTNIEYLFSIDKIINKFEPIGSQIGIQNCFRVDWIYTGVNTFIRDYISNLGLMKRTISVKDVNIYYDEGNPDLSFTADVTESYTLVEIVR